ncbi:hypothetical protein M3Y99_00701500 [Aphelenchoides fujianensis]|nr:hypothetical protein M3Y99_00701500 [Aphelenchoides fujianensis]
MSFRNPAVEQTLAAFCARHIYLRCEWVEAAVEFVQRRQAPPPRQLPTAPPPQAPALPTFPTVPVILPPALPKPALRPTAPTIRPAAPRVRPTVPSVQPAPAATQWPTASAAPTAVRMNAPSARPVVPAVRPPPASSQWVGATALSLVPKAPRARATAATTQRPAAPSNPPPTADGGLEQTSIKSFMTQKRRSPMVAAVQQPPAAKRAHFSIVSPPKPSGTFAKTQALPDVRPATAEATRSAATGRSTAPTSGRSAAATTAAEGGSQGGSRRPPMSERDFSQLLQLNTRRLVIPHAAAREFWGLLARSAGALQPNETLESVQSILPSSIFFLRYFPLMQQELPKYERAMRALRTINTRLQLEIKTGRNIYDRSVDPFLNQVDNFLSKVRLFIDSARRCGFGPQDLRVELAVRLKSEIIPQLTVRMLREQLGLKALDENAGILQKYTVQLSGICVLVGIVS